MVVRPAAMAAAESRWRMLRIGFTPSETAFCCPLGILLAQRFGAGEDDPSAPAGEPTRIGVLCPVAPPLSAEKQEKSVSFRLIKGMAPLGVPRCRRGVSKGRGA